MHTRFVATRILIAASPADGASNSGAGEWWRSVFGRHLACLREDRQRLRLSCVIACYALATAATLFLAAAGNRDAIGYLASLFVLGSFGSEEMKSLRILALLSNAAFIAYAVTNHLGPVLALHVLLLPINALRLWQLLATPRLPAYEAHLKSAASLEKKRSRAGGV